MKNPSARLHPLCLLYLFQIALVTPALPSVPGSAQGTESPPASPFPADQTATLTAWQGLRWTAGTAMVKHEVYLWKNAAAVPAVPTATVDASAWQPPAYLEFATAYHWKVISHTPAGGRVTGPTWSFITRNPGAVVEPPYDISPNAQAARRAGYTLDGLKRIRSAGSPVKAGLRIGFYGDSNTDVIEWQKELTDTLSKAGVISLNRGINGADASQLREGIRKYNAGGGLPAPKPFPAQVAEDKAGLAVIYIGINDAMNNHPPTTKAAYKGHIQAMVDSALAKGAKVVLITPAMYNEKPDGSNVHDKTLDGYAEACREVAEARKVALVHARSLFLDYLRNHNFAVADDGTVSYPKATGVVNYDVVHHNGTGKRLLSDWAADGILRALSTTPTAVAPAKPSRGTSVGTGKVRAYRWVAGGGEDARGRRLSAP